ncbi:hypothetical protein MRB53_026198 [Persea americana]|uniref:Uncharacterized protein n=1 Tax=Persea americana TaxID=3435 RepID=A0ACC2LHB4_PERAE|nr:hypothetical protein MRB53_026198 [Persea americana]
MTRTRIARKRALTPVESGEGPSGDLGGVPSGRLEDVPELGHTGEPEAGQTAARPRKRRKKQRTKEDPHLADEIKAGKVRARVRLATLMMRSIPRPWMTYLRPMIVMIRWTTGVAREAITMELQASFVAKEVWES